MDAPLYYPLPGTYAVAQLDVDTTVQDLDSDAQQAARNIKPAQCLVYLYRALEFPSPNRPWTRFAAYLVGPGWRAEDAENCFTADMCVPIFPNTSHPNGRAPVRTTPAFPFSNCSHWAYVDVLLRVANGVFPSSDDPNVIRLPGGQQAIMDTFLTGDLTAAVQAKRERSAIRDGIAEGGQEKAVLPEEESEEIFVWRRNVPNELVPVVTVSSDLAGTLDENNLPDPAEFLSQSSALVRIVRHSSTWQKALAEQPPNDDDLASISRVSIVFSDETVLSHEERHEATLGAKGIRKFSQAIKWLLGRAESPDPEPEEDDVSRHFFDQDSEVHAPEPLPKKPKRLSSLWARLGLTRSWHHLYSNNTRRSR